MIPLMITTSLKPTNLISRFFNSAFFIIVYAFIIIYLQSQMSSIYTKYIGVFDVQTIPTLVFFAAYTIVCFFILPVVASQICLTESLQQLGLTFPKDKKLAVLLIFVSLLFLLPYIIHFSSMQEFSGYSLSKLGFFKFLAIICTFFPIYYIAEEFFFRGFLFIALWDRVGWHSFWITDIIFTLSHLGKPFLEVLLCIPASIILNAITLSSRSIVPAIVVHATLGIVLSVLVTY
jgi:membrane protease YdiL (CAAX protease family)